MVRVDILMRGSNYNKTLGFLNNLWFNIRTYECQPMANVFHVNGEVIVIIIMKMIKIAKKQLSHCIFILIYRVKERKKVRKF